MSVTLASPADKEHTLSRCCSPAPRHARPLILITVSNADFPKVQIVSRRVRFIQSNAWSIECDRQDPNMLFQPTDTVESLPAAKVRKKRTKPQLVRLGADGHYRFQLLG